VPVEGFLGSEEPVKRVALRSSGETRVWEADCPSAQAEQGGVSFEEEDADFVPKIRPEAMISSVGATSSSGGFSFVARSVSKSGSRQSDEFHCGGDEDNHKVFSERVRVETHNHLEIHPELIERIVAHHHRGASPHSQQRDHRYVTSQSDAIQTQSNIASDDSIVFGRVYQLEDTIAAEEVELTALCLSVVELESLFTSETTKNERAPSELKSSSAAKSQ
jgi:hypothetical protein